jgi:hypothetical protein
MLGIKSDGVPYFLFFLTGSSCWRLFERSVIAATRSLDQNRGLIKKVFPVWWRRFPRRTFFVEFGIVSADVAGRRLLLLPEGHLSRLGFPCFWLR